MTRDNLAGVRLMLAPKSIAVIGASRRPGTIGRRIVQNLIHHEFNGSVYPVNPLAESVCSVRAHPTIADVPEPVDIAVIAVPAPRVLEVAEACGHAGVEGIVVISAGFAETGGMHAVGLFTAEGELIASREDVGRHNAMDKLVGAALMNGTLPWSERIVLLSGRASFELIQKAMMAGAPLVAAIGAPSTLALELAQSAGITLVAFLRSGGCNVYCHPSRVRPARGES